MNICRQVVFFILTMFLFAVPGTGLFAQKQGRNYDPIYTYPQQEFVVNLSSSVPDLDAHRAYNAEEAQILTALTEGLFTYDPYTLEPLPALASAWRISENGLSWTFIIRDNAAFEDGTPITAHTIVDSWISLLSKGKDAPYASMFDCIEGAKAFRTGKSGKKPEIHAVDDRTLYVKLVSPTFHFSQILCHHAFTAVLPEKGRVMKMDGKDVFVPLSSGPFKVSSVNDGEIVLERNLNYWDVRNVTLPSIKLVFSSDAEKMTALFNQGKIHWLSGVFSIDKIIDYSSLYLTPMFSTEYFFFRTTWGAGKNPEIRKALLKAVPWTKLRDGYLIPASTLVLPIAGYPEVEGLVTSDLDDARKILEKAGISDPSKEEPLVIFYPESSLYDEKADVLKSAWENLGFKVEKKSVPVFSYYDMLDGNDYTIGLTSWIGDFANPIAFLEIFRPESNLNDSGWKSGEFESLLVKASGEASPEDGYKILAEAEQLLLDEAVIIPLSHNPALNVIDTNGLSGWYSNALDIHPFKYIRFTPRRALPGIALRE